MKLRYLLLVVFLLGFVSSEAFGQARLRPGDVVNLRLGGAPSEDVSLFSAVYTIDNRGQLNLPYIGEIKAAGLLPSQVQRNIESKLKADEIYTAPTITINVDNSSLFVNIGGEVKGPGRIPFTPDMTLMTAINAAGGFSDYADKRKVNVTRDGTTTRFDGKAIAAGADRDPLLRPGDRVHVEPSIF